MRRQMHSADRVWGKPRHISFLCIGVSEALLSACFIGATATLYTSFASSTHCKEGET